MMPADVEGAQLATLDHSMRRAPRDSKNLTHVFERVDLGRGIFGDRVDQSLPFLAVLVHDGSLLSAQVCTGTAKAEVLGVSIASAAASSAYTQVFEIPS